MWRSSNDNEDCNGGLWLKEAKARVFIRPLRQYFAYLLLPGLNEACLERSNQCIFLIQRSKMAEHDLTPKIAPFVDPHLLLPVLNWLEESKVPSPLISHPNEENFMII